MKLKWLTAGFIVVFCVITTYLILKGDILYHKPAPGTRPSPAAISSAKKAIKDGVYAPSNSAIVH